MMNKWVVVEYRVAREGEVIGAKQDTFSGKPSDEEICSAMSWAHEKK